MTTSAQTNKRVAWLASGAIAAQVLFVAGWLVGGSIEGHGYSPARHDISDLGALTAHHTWLAVGTLAMSGGLTMAFAIWALPPSLAASGGGALGAVLVAFSLTSLDSLSDAFFRLDCRAADTGCTMSRAAASWHGKIHLIAFGVAAIATIVAPFVLARRMRALDEWRDLAGRARAFGYVTIAVLLAAMASSDSSVQGVTQRVAATLVPLGVVALAWRVRRVATVPGVGFEPTRPLRDRGF